MEEELPNLHICKMLVQEGCGMDVTSDGELFRALKDIVVTVAHGGPSARELGAAVGRLIERRMVVN